MTTAKDVPVGTPTKREEMEHPVIEGVRVVDPPPDHALGPDHVRSTRMRMCGLNPDTAHCRQALTACDQVKWKRRTTGAAAAAGGAPALRA